MLFTLAQARAVKPLDNVTKYPDAAVQAAGDLATDALEHACAVHFTPTSFSEVLDGNGRCDLMLWTAKPTAIASATVAGLDVTSTVLVYSDGRVYRPNGWACGRQNVTVTGTAGWPVCPPRVARACLLLAKRFLVDSPVNDRATTLINEDGTTQYLVTAGVRSALFDIPEANAVVQDYGLQQGYLVA